VQRFRGGLVFKRERGRDSERGSERAREREKERDKGPRAWTLAFLITLALLYPPTYTAEAVVGEREHRCERAREGEREGTRERERERERERVCVCERERERGRLARGPPRS